jgi:FOG: CBS domain
MYVRNRMTKIPYTASRDTKITTILDVMAEREFHRVPIVDDKGNLLGLITEGVIRAHSPSKATSLSIHELNYLLSKTTAGDIMIKEVHTIHPDALLEEAAVEMRKHGVGCLPVIVDEKVVGIITQNDIFDAFIDLLGYHDIGSRIVVEIEEDKPGVLHDISGLLMKNGASISHLGVYHEEGKILVVIKSYSKDAKLQKKILEEHGYNVIEATTKTKI